MEGVGELRAVSGGWLWNDAGLRSSPFKVVLTVLS